MVVLRLLIVMLALTGCNKAVEDFVKGGGKVKDPPVVVVIPEDGLVGRKLSPGAVRATGTGLFMEAHITPTKQILSGPSVTAEMSLHQTR